jgi:hypothetical protein
MAMEFPENTHPDLELGIGGDEVLLKHLVAASDRFSALINEVARSYTGASPASIRWVVEIKPGSVRLPLHGSPANDAIAAPAIPELADVIAKGVALIEEKPERPEYFTDKALEKAKELAKVPAIYIRNGGPPVQLTGHLMANVDQLLGKPQRVFGTVEGRLEKLDIHGPSTFIIYSSLTGRSVKCRFGKYVSLEEVTAAVGKRVGARGLVDRRPNGEQISVEVQELRLLPEPVSADEVLGIFKGYDEVET